ncbi:A24 family peptidase [Alkaliphilus serpentinus]|uniref:Prepilin peptidase n=1 Tax=Alkaliphilus serpentinus TaxID=1482731 RepID=A0A833HR18_9FIRM|nr:A24 family peptidase [Alkaliphilus serpentinus]KAB3532809.1 prepilin peptidase [Alkaliphilus serpentinus]
MIRFYITFVLVLLACMGDVKTYKVKNSLTIPFAILGGAINILDHGTKGLVDSVLGILLPIVILFILFVLRMLGAGDIKLFAAIGSILGIKMVFNVMIYSFIAGGIIAFLLILLRKNGLKRIRHFLLYMKLCLFSRYLLPYEDFEKKDDGKFKFTIAILMGLLTTLFLHLYTPHSLNILNEIL